MRNLMMLAPVMALAMVSANCSGGAFNSPTSPGVGVSDSATEARGSGGGGGKKPGSGGGGTSGGGSLALVVSTDNNGDGLPNWNDTITFNVSTTATAEPTVELTCYQNGSLAYIAQGGFYDSYPWPWTKYMLLNSGAWTGGSADCTANLFPLGAKSSVLATLRFTAGA